MDQSAFVPCRECGGLGCQACDGQGFDAQIIAEERWCHEQGHKGPVNSDDGGL